MSVLEDLIIETPAATNVSMFGQIDTILVFIGAEDPGHECLDMEARTPRGSGDVGREGVTMGTMPRALSEWAGTHLEEDRIWLDSLRPRD